MLLRWFVMLLSGFLDELGHQVLLSQINSGNARPNAVARSRTLFSSYHDWLSKGAHHRIRAAAAFELSG
jgi:hypothetical protein